MKINDIHQTKMFHRTRDQLAMLVAIVFLLVGAGCDRPANDRSKAVGPSQPNLEQETSGLSPPLAESPPAEAQPSGGDQAEASDPLTTSSPDAGGDPPVAPGRLAALAQSISQAYEAAKSSGQTAATSARDWLLNDINSGGRWEYRVIPTTEKDPAQLEVLLNAMGREGWECFHVESKGEALLLFMQRHPSSVTRNIPFSDLMKVLPYLGLGQGE